MVLNKGDGKMRSLTQLGISEWATGTLVKVTMKCVDRQCESKPKSSHIESVLFYKIKQKEER